MVEYIQTCVPTWHRVDLRIGAPSILWSVVIAPPHALGRSLRQHPEKLYLAPALGTGEGKDIPHRRQHAIDPRPLVPAAFTLDLDHPALLCSYRGFCAFDLWDASALLKVASCVALVAKPFYFQREIVIRVMCVNHMVWLNSA